MLKAKPDHPQAPLLLADCRLLLGEWKQVIAILDPLLERDPDNKAVLYMLGTALMRDRQYERGQRVLDRILRQGDSAEAHLVLAIASREANDDIAAEKELRRALELDPDPAHRQRHPRRRARPHGRGRRRDGGAAARAGGEPQPLRLAPAARPAAPPGLEDGRGDGAPAARPSRCGPGTPACATRSPWSRSPTSDLEAARATLEALVKDEPRFTEAHVSLATVYYRLGRRADGQRHQAIVQQLKRDEKAREDAEKARQQGAPAPPP